MLHITCKLVSHFFIPAMLIGTIDPTTLFTSFSVLDIGLGSQGQRKVKKKSIGFIFTYTFQPIRMKLYVVMT